MQVQHQKYSSIKLTAKALVSQANTAIVRLCRLRRLERVLLYRRPHRLNIKRGRNTERLMAFAGCSASYAGPACPFSRSVFLTPSPFQFLLEPLRHSPFGSSPRGETVISRLILRRLSQTCLSGTVQFHLL